MWQGALEVPRSRNSLAPCDTVWASLPAHTVTICFPGQAGTMVEISALLPLAGLVKLTMPMMRAAVNHRRGILCNVSRHSCSTQSNLPVFRARARRKGDLLPFSYVFNRLPEVSLPFLLPRGCTHYSALTPGQLRDATFCRSSDVVY